MKTKRCRYCGRAFKPDPRTALFQKCCGRGRCVQARSRQKLRRWRKLYPEHARRWQTKVRAWAKAYPDYWRRYRAKHADYRERERRRMARKRRGQKRVAKVTAIRAILDEKVRAIDRAAGPKTVAKETPILRRVAAIEDCLRSTVAAVCVAKQTPMAAIAGSGG